ncbi:helix-turn-helix domain-containing protein [Hydrocarboniphaga sp.]|uniref:helix-turn-helix domain-containing protein n=1 Tax=Hydrocarboniphaga sp. TaxID=2033016 RepID=UPI003D148727
MNKFTLSTYLSMTLDLSEWISQAEAARLRGVSRQAIAKLVANGRLATLDVGGRAFVRRGDIVSFEPNPAGRPKNPSDE